VKVDVAILEKREMQYLYKEGDDFVFMDTKTYDQMSISAATVGDAANYMLENTEAIVAVNEGNPLYIELSSFSSTKDYLHRTWNPRRSFIWWNEASNS